MYYSLPIAIFLSIFGRSIRVDCAPTLAADSIKAVYASFLCPTKKRVDFHCRIGPAKSVGQFIYTRNGTRERLEDLGELLFLFDKDLTIELQRQRSDLYFVHAGVIRFRRSAVAFVAPSGTGKSTTIWALLRLGCEYVSDELLPVDLATRRVLWYPRALCLKALPRGGLRPAATLAAGQLHYIPTRSRAAGSLIAPLPLRVIFFLERTPATKRPRMISLSGAEAGAHLYANTLNALAHPNAGLDAAMFLAEQTRCYKLQMGTPSATARAVHAFLERT